MARRTIQVGRRTLLAKNCAKCGHFQQAKRFYKTAEGFNDAYCVTCRGGHRREETAAAQAVSVKTARNAGKPWSYPDIRTLERMADNGKSVEEIAQTLNRTVYGVKTKLNKVRSEYIW